MNEERIQEIQEATMRKKTNNQLAKIAEARSGWEPEAIEAAKRELEEQGLEPPPIETQSIAIENEQEEKCFLIKWIMVSTIGWILVSAIGFNLAYGDINRPDYPWIFMLLVGGLIGGAIGGILQWDFLRLRFPYLGSRFFTAIWVWSSIICFSLGFFVNDWIWGGRGLIQLLLDIWYGDIAREGSIFRYNAANDSLQITVAFAILALTGIPQWFALRRYISNAGWWVIVMPIGILVSLLPVSFCVWTLNYDADISNVVDNFATAIIFGAILGAIGGVVYGLITGVALNKLLPSPVSHSPSSEQDAI